MHRSALLLSRKFVVTSICGTCRLDTFGFGAQALWSSEEFGLSHWSVSLDTILAAVYVVA